MHSGSFPQILEALIQFGADCYCKDENDKIPLHLASESGRAHYVEVLARAALPALFERDECGRTPLHCAVMNKRR